MSWNPWLIFLIMGTTLVSYLSAILIEKTDSKKLKKLYLILTLIICLGVLVFFKYFNFLSQSVIDFLNLFSLNLDTFALDLILPVGISFYTFQTLSYSIDVYRGKISAEKHLGYYALFVSYFPQLVAGPIERPDNLIPQLRAEHKASYDNILAGSKILLSGFFRKVVIADFCGIFVNNVYYNLASSNSLAVFIASGLFLLEIYFDFSGYSEIAIGSARIMGVKLSCNFDRPFQSQTYSEFFRRWHITLNLWFKDYLYIPLGGNRKGKVRKIFNLWIVFLLCGLWHGASWTYVLWGAYAAFFITIESLLHKPFTAFCSQHNIDLEKPHIRMIRSLVMFLIYSFSAILFRSTDMNMAILGYTRLFTGFGGSFFSNAFIQLGLTVENIVQLVACLTAMALLYHFAYDKKFSLPSDFSKLSSQEKTSFFASNVSVFAFGIIAIAVCWLFLLGTDASSSFAYFQF